MNALTQKWVEASPLAWAIAARPAIPHPTRGLIRPEPYQYQARLWADRSATRVILKARQTGFSQAVALEALHTALQQPSATVLIVSRNLEAAINVLRYVKVALNTPGMPAPRIVKDNETHVGLANGSRILSIAATRSAGRTYAATAVYLDEFAHMPWATEIYRAVAPTTSQGGRLTVLSTPNGRANAFFLLWSGEWGGGWSKHTVPWWRCPPYNPDGWKLKGDAESRGRGEKAEWFARERPKYTGHDWAQEYGIDFVESGQAVFRPEDIERAHGLAQGLRAPVERQRYVTFWDIGRRHDATVGTTLDITETPYQVVAFDRHEGLPYPAIQALIERRHGEYPGRHWVESNGVGDPVIENLSVRVEPWVTTAKSKQQMITALQLALERGSLGIPEELRQMRTELLLYQWNDEDLVQDCVMSLAGAVAVAEQGGLVSAPARVVKASALFG